MLTWEEMPDDNRDLAKVEVAFPYLPDNSPDSCPVSMTEVLEYLALEVPDGENLEADDLQFARTAQVAEKQYWIWRFTDPLGDDSYATVSVDSAGMQCLGYDANDYGLTPEQFMLGDYHNVF